MASFVDDEAEVGTTSEDEPMDAEESSAKKKKSATISSDEDEDDNNTTKTKVTLKGLKKEVEKLKRGNYTHSVL